MRGYELGPMAPHDRAAWATGGPPPLPLRPDMAAQFAAEGGRLPEGPAWMLTRRGELVALGGVEPIGGAHGAGWLLCGDDLTARDWLMIRKALVEGVLGLRRTRTVRFVHALADVGRPKAAALLRRLGFESAGRTGDDLKMTLEVF